MKRFSRDVPQNNTPSVRKDARHAWPALTLVSMLVIIALLSSCARLPFTSTPSEVTEPPPTEVPATTEAAATESPGERTACSGGDGKFTCHGLSDHILTLENVPVGAIPYLLDISDEAALREAPREEGIGCIFVVVGDLAFYEEDDEPVHTFETPVTGVYTLTEEDKAACSDYLATLATEQGIKENEVDYIPVYFSDGMWKDLSEDYEVVIDGNTITMTVTTWGDSPIGGGTKP